MDTIEQYGLNLTLTTAARDFCSERWFNVFPKANALSTVFFNHDWNFSFPRSW